MFISEAAHNQRMFGVKPQVFHSDPSDESQLATWMIATFSVLLFADREKKDKQQLHNPKFCFFGLLGMCFVLILLEMLSLLFALPTGCEKACYLLGRFVKLRRSFPDGHSGEA